MSFCVTCGADLGESADCARCLPTECRPVLVAHPAAPAPPKTQDQSLRVVAGRYRLDDLIGQGGFGVVYRATDTRLARPVALKLLLQSRFGPEGHDIERFRRESLILASLDHPNIVPVYDADVDEDRAFIVMKLVDGQSLSRRLQSERLSERDSLRVFIQVSAALEHAHARSVLHRDIKPSNVLEDRLGNAFLADFGVSTAGFLPRVTQAGAVVGSLHYMAPEALAGTVSAASDIYSLGALLHELVFGAMLFEGDTAAALIHKICYDEPPLLANPPADVSPEIVAFMRELTMKDVAKRTLTAGATRIRAEELCGLVASVSTRSVDVRNLPVATDAETAITSISDSLDHLEDAVREISGRCASRTPQIDEILGSASQFLTDCSTLVELLEKHQHLPNPDSSLPALALSLSHLAREVERSLLKIGGGSMAAFTSHFHRSLVSPLQGLLQRIEESGRASAPGDFFEFEAPDLDDSGNPDESWVSRLSDGSDLEKHDAMVALVGPAQATLLLRMSSLEPEARRQALDAIWGLIHIVMLEGRSRSRAVLEAAISMLAEDPSSSNWRLLYSLFRKSGSGYWDPEIVRHSLSNASSEERRVFGRCLLLHPSPEYRKLAFETVDPADYWSVISSPGTHLDWLLELWRHLAGTVSDDYLKVFFVCVRDRLMRRVDGAEVIHAADLLKEFFEINCFHEDVFFRMLMELDERVREWCRQNRLLIDFDAEYVERAKAFMGGGVRKEREIEEWSTVPLPIQRRLARSGHFLRHFACHPVDQIAMECLPHILKLETGRPFADLTAINARLIGELAKEKRLFQNEDARLALVRNPKTPAYAVMKYIGFLRRDSMLKLAEAREGNTLAREYAKKMVGRRL